MKYADVRPEIEELCDYYISDEAEYNFDLTGRLFEIASLEDLYQKLEDTKDFKATNRRMNYLVFYSVIGAIKKHKDPSSIPILLRFCNDEMYAITPFQEGWVNAFCIFPQEILLPIFFANFHVAMPQGVKMLAEIVYGDLMLKNEDLFKTTMLLGKKADILDLWEALYIYICEYEDEGNEIFQLHERLKDYYLANYMRVVPGS